MPPHSITNFEIQEYHWNEPKFNRVHSRNSLPRVRDGTYVINLDEYESTGTHWIALYLNGGSVGASNDATYFLSFEVGTIPAEIDEFICNKNITTNIYRMQVYNSILCR